MKRGRSTSTPTREEAERIVACKEGACVVCALLAERGDLAHELVQIGGDFHHCKSGNIRRGHLFGFCLCRWHHERHPWGQWTHRQMAYWYGVSLKDGSRRFHAEYGSDDELIARQDSMIGYQRQESEG